MNKIKRWYATVVSFFLYPHIVRKIQKSKSSIFFFFPCYETGGGETVHAAIMEAVRDLHPTCIITHISKNDDMKEAFMRSAQLIELQRWGWKKSFKRKMIKSIATILNDRKDITVFGCNSHFFYELLPQLSSSIEKIDLMHTFLGDQDPRLSFEHYSLPMLRYLTKRVVLGNSHKFQLEKFYSKHDIAEPPRTIIIPNKIEASDKITHKDFSAEFEVLFVARNTFEKRSHLFLEIAKGCLQEKLPFRFVMIGDFEELRTEVSQNVTITGRIKSKNKLKNHYDSAHIIIICSIFEGFPMVLLEGMAQGVIPISTNVGEVPNFISEERQTGFIISNDGDEMEIVRQFVSKLRQLSNNKLLMNKISVNVQTLVRENFSESSFNTNYRHLLLNDKK